MKKNSQYRLFPVCLSSPFSFDKKTKSFFTIYYLFQRVNRYVCGRSNPSDFSAKWLEDFSHRPSWCDADMALQQIRRVSNRGWWFVVWGTSFCAKSMYDIDTTIDRWMRMREGTIVWVMQAVCMIDVLVSIFDKYADFLFLGQSKRQQRRVVFTQLYATCFVQNRLCNRITCIWSDHHWIDSIWHLLCWITKG